MANKKDGLFTRLISAETGVSVKRLIPIIAFFVLVIILIVAFLPMIIIADNNKEIILTIIEVMG